MTSDMVVPAGRYKWNYGIMQELFQDVRPDVMTSCTQNIQCECLVFCDFTINGNLCMIEDLICAHSIMDYNLIYLFSKEI